MPRQVSRTAMPALSSAASLESTHCAPWAVRAAMTVMAICCATAFSEQSAAAAQQFRAVPQATVDPQVIRLMGDKARARRVMKKVSSSTRCSRIAPETCG